jgi:hypothetical protein
MLYCFVKAGVGVLNLAGLFPSTTFDTALWATQEYYKADHRGHKGAVGRVHQGAGLIPAFDVNLERHAQKHSHKQKPELPGQAVVHRWPRHPLDVI